MHEIDEIRLEACAGFNNADVVCGCCLYTARVVIVEDWPVYAHPHQTLIASTYIQYLRFMELCPQAVIFVSNTIDKVFCPTCGKTQLAASSCGRYNLSALHESLHINKHDKTRIST